MSKHSPSNKLDSFINQQTDGSTNKNGLAFHGINTCPRVTLGSFLIERVLNDPTIRKDMTFQLEVQCMISLKRLFLVHK